MRSLVVATGALPGDGSAWESSGRALLGSFAQLFPAPLQSLCTMIRVGPPVRASPGIAPAPRTAVGVSGRTAAARAQHSPCLSPKLSSVPELSQLPFQGRKQESWIYEAAWSSLRASPIQTFLREHICVNTASMLTVTRELWWEGRGVGGALQAPDQKPLPAGAWHLG